ncbi:MAG: xanthine dehydrogenase family protein, partial [Eubacteriales bacterium]|nr:xanthine dehydrogenase family protein [Eubacteriales bacterium]
MENISDPVVRKDHKAKITGCEKYVGDLTRSSDGREILSAKLVRTQKAHAEILNIHIPDLPESYYYIDGSCAPRNVAYYPLNDTAVVLTEEEAERIKNSTPLFADKFSEYAGQPVGMIVGPDDKIVRELISKCTIEYKELPAVIRLADAHEVITHYERSLGNYPSAFLTADFVYEESFSTGRQYQAYLETQSIMAEPESDSKIFIHGSMQCPFTVRDSIAYALNCAPEDVHIRQDAVGGAFGGKEDFPSFLAPQVAVAARKTGKPVRLIFDRSEDLQFNYKRHPSLTHIRAAVKNGKVTALDIDGKLDSGAFLSSSGDVAMRYFTTFPGVYSIPNLHVTVSVMKTNTPPTGAFRGFGGPQCEFAMDMLMSHLADELKTDELEFKKLHMAEKGKCTSTGGAYKYEVPLPVMIQMAERSTSYSEKRVRYTSMHEGRLKRGIGIAFANHGCPLGGSIEWELVKPKVHLIKHSNGTVDLYTGQAELGQGVRTAFCKIAAHTLEIPYEKVNTPYPDSDLTEDTGVTAASRSIVCVGKAIEDAALKLKKNWKDGEEQEVTAQYQKPDDYAEYDPKTMVGTQYADFSW